MPASNIYDILPLKNGKWLVVGSFANVNGDPNADFAVYFDPSSNLYSAINSTPLNNTTRVALGLSDGNVILGGSFTDAGGNPSADFICILNTTTNVYQALNLTSLNNAVLDLVELTNGDIILVGSFSNVAGDANADYAVRWLRSTTGQYQTLSTTPFNLPPEAVELMPDKTTVVFGGDFTNAGGDANADYVAKLVGSTYSALNSNPLTATVNDMLLSQNGLLYLASDADNRLNVWNGVGAFSTLAGGANNAATRNYQTKKGDIITMGWFTTVGSLSVSSVVGWNGSAYFPIAADIPSPFTLRGVIAEDVSGNLILAGWSTLGNIAVGSVTPVNNTGSYNAWPKLKFTGPGQLREVKNYTTGEAIYFNITLLSGETAYLDLTPGKISFTSSFRGNILSAIIPGSNLAKFKLVPGLNNISTFINGSVTAATNVTMRWRNAYSSIDAATQ